MANVLELFALVQTESREVGAPIIKIVRTYESDTRAQIDMQLLEEVSPGPYVIIKTIHVES
jgi:hypothetical protein